MASEIPFILSVAQLQPLFWPLNYPCQPALLSCSSPWQTPPPRLPWWAVGLPLLAPPGLQRLGTEEPSPGWPYPAHISRGRKNRIEMQVCWLFSPMKRLWVNSRGSR